MFMSTCGHNMLCLKKLTFQLSPRLNGLCNTWKVLHLVISFSFSHQVCVLRPLCCCTKHHQKWRRFSLRAKIKTLLKNLGYLHTARKNHMSIWTRFLHTSNFHRDLRHLPVFSSVALYMQHAPLLSVLNEISVSLSWCRFALLGDKSTALKKLKLFWIIQIKISVFVHFLRSSHTGGLCTTFPSPCRFTSTHFAPKTLDCVDKLWIIDEVTRSSFEMAT